MPQTPSGIVLYDSHYYFEHDDRSTKATFFDAAQKYASDHDEIKVFLTEEFTFGNNVDGTFMRNGQFYWNSSNNNKPTWCIYRGNNWKHAFFVEQIGIQCFPSSDIIRISNDKAVANALMGAYGVSTPNSVFMKGLSDTSYQQEYPSVVKMCDGYKGDGVYRVSDRYALNNAVHHMNGDYLIQDAMPTGSDIRILIIGDHVDAAVRRESGETDFRSNRSLGGKRELVKLNKQEQKLIQKVISILPGNIGYISCDFLFDINERPVFCELNSTPGSFDAYGGDVRKLFKRYIQYVEKTINS